MHPSEADLTQGRLGKQIFRFSLPLMASNLLQVVFNLADIAVVGRFVGAGALGSVGSTAILISLFTGLLIGMGGGINALVARYIGAKREKDTSEAVHASFILILLMGILLLAVGLCFGRGILSLMNTKEELIDGAVLYLHIYALGMPALALFNHGNAILSAVGDTKRPLRYLTFSGILNVILNLIFVIYFGWGVAGVAIASVVSQYVSGILILLVLIRSDMSFSLRLSRLRLYADKAKLTIALGVPSGLQNAIFALANLFIQASVNSFDAIMVEGNSAAINADSIVYDLMAAFYTACSSFIGQNYGANKPRRVRSAYRISLAYSFAAGAIIGWSLAIFGRKFLALFTTDPAVIEAGMLRLRIMGLSYAFSAFMDCTIAASRGLGKTIVPTIIVISGSCVFRIIWIVTVFAYFHTVPSLYLLYIFSWAITAAAEIIYYRRVFRNTFPGWNAQTPES